MKAMTSGPAHSDVRELATDEFDVVAGGLNPQPLPPRYLVSLFTSRFSLVALNPQPLPPRY